MNCTPTQTERALLFELRTYIDKANLISGVKTISITVKQYALWEKIQKRIERYPENNYSLGIRGDTYQGYLIHKHGTERKSMREHQEQFNLTCPYKA